MKLLLLIAAIILLIPGTSLSSSERDHQLKWCTEGEIEYRLPDNTRVDCLMEEYAIEFDWASKWAEAIGQSLFYAKITGKQAGVVLIVSPGETRFINRLLTVSTDYGIRVWLMDRME